MPPGRRIKNYTAQSGAVYEYVFARSARSRRWWRPGTEYAFTLRERRVGEVPVRIFLPDRHVRDCEKRRGRELSSAEKYAVAKMRLFALFDDEEERIARPRDVNVTPLQIDEALAALGIE